jgi:uncharacterized protein YjiS (DUF1127 family)
VIPTFWCVVVPTPSAVDGDCQGEGGNRSEICADVHSRAAAASDVFSLAEANRAIVLVLERMNAHVMRRLGLSRSDLFASIERPALRALPASNYEFAEWRLARVALDYHVEIEGFYYSVPHALIRAQVDVRITSRTIEVFHHGKRVVAHQRRYGGPL